MIISCNNCNKKFEINSELIPDSGRLLMCSKCNSQWFYKKEVVRNEVIIDDIISDDVLINNDNIKEDLSKNDIDDKDNILAENQKKEQTLKNKISPNILYKILVFIISTLALIILVDTFKDFISLFIPNIEFIFYNLYESIKDIVLFIKDLFK